MPRTVHRACPLCEACCGLVFTVDEGAVTEVRPDRDDPFSQGHVCPKGLALPELHDDPDRLRQPLRKVGSGWEPLAWDAALDLAAERLRSLRDEHGPDALAVYLGNPTVHNLGALLFGPDLLRDLGTRQRYSATSVDQLPHMLVAYWMFGHQLLMAVPDIDRSDLVVMLGANPVVSNGSIMTAPGIGKRLRAIRDRGGEVVLFDPRRTETARHTTHHFVRPGTDALLLAALVQVVFDEGLVRLGRLEGLVDGLEGLAEHFAPWTPERVADRTGVAPEVVRDLARRLASTERAVVYGRLGTSVQAFGVTCQWLVQLLNLLTGHLDTPGGAMFTTPALDPLGRVRLVGRGGHDRWRTRVRGLPEVGGELPVAALAEEISSPGEGRVRALVTLAGNPVLSTPDGEAMDRALAQLDFLVCIDPYLNETTRHADLILPPVSPLERDHYDLVFNLLAVRNVAKWSPRVLEPADGALDDWQILAGLHARMLDSPAKKLALRVKRRLGPRGLVGLGLRLGPHGGLGGLSLRKLEASVHGVDLGALEPVLPERLQTPDGRVQAAPERLVSDLGRLGQLLERDEAFDLQLIGRRQVRTNNSWLHNLPALMRGEDRCTLLMHPDDAASRGLADGDTARVRSRVGEVEAPVERSDTMMPGVVSLPHGFGHGRQGTRLSVAGAKPGVSLNTLTDTAEVDPVGGTAVLTGTPVRVEAC